MLEQSLVIIKPEAMKKNLIGYVLEKLLEHDHTSIVGIKTIKVSENLARKHYEHLKDKPFFQNLLTYFTGKEHNIEYIIALVCQGENVIDNIREIAGATDPEKAVPTSIRGAFGRINKNDTYENVIHASADQVDAEREIKLWFEPSELMNVIYKTKDIKVEKNEKVWA